MTTLELHQPVHITSRLLPGVLVGDGTISIKRVRSKQTGRTSYRYYIDTPTFSYTRADLHSGVGGGCIQEALSSLLSFLVASAEAVRYGSDSDNSDLFPKKVAEWAYMNSDELSMLSVELEERRVIKVV